ncbi:MAG: SEC59/DGK1/VTE5 family protein [Pseudanabaenaceae cyanobacterium SKYGB_i_bin29]|nr:SEC59/DGK1/VTE5 family protein [Pseudanabaenaceae cyanobacterium SKYG29]MDW8420834.1 SEC59/DGK1/VTE5 family protein [Pseudanabaenaceae cyanobacterium SKYGB_i_bin29]
MTISNNLFWQLALVLLWLASVFSLAAIVQKIGTTEQVRKVVHIGTGNILPLAWYFNFPLWFCLAFCVAFCVITFLSYHLPILPVINSVGRRTYGVFFYALSITVLVAYFWTIKQPAFAVLGVLVMSWGDGIAALVGQKWGKHPYQIWGNHKSWEGSGVMALICFVVTVTVLATARGIAVELLPIGCLVAIVATICEAVSPAGSDNLTVPIGSGLLAYLLTGIWG